jgi:N-acetylmannosamine-6-phosphate 2-epimerase / N-acetylmannosamine kinase
LTPSDLASTLRGGLVVSCQAWDDDPMHAPDVMARFARAAVSGGAVAIRANGPDDIRAIRHAVSVPVIGLQKRLAPDGQILITPTVDDARALVDAGAHAVAIDCTARGCRYGALERLSRVRGELHVPVTADIAALDEALAAEAAGADFILSTMRGYTAETEAVRSFDAAFIAGLVRALRVPVIAEGRIWTVDEALAAIDAGALAVVVGSAITRPKDITERFTSALSAAHARRGRPVAALDLGGTNLKGGVVSPDGEVLAPFAEPTSLDRGREGVLDQMAGAAARLVARHDVAAIGVAAAGWVDAAGKVVYATPNLPDWTGADVAGTLSARLRLPVFVENDANALAVGEKRFGAARSAATFVCLTLGTGVGGGCYIGGALQRGAHSIASAIGHLVVEPGGIACNCGQVGCLEPYANSAALLRYAGAGQYSSPAAVIAAANAGDDRAASAVRQLARYLAAACAQTVRLLDPELIVIGGGLAQDNPLLFRELVNRLAGTVSAWDYRGVRVVPSALGYFAGVAGAGALAFEGLRAASAPLPLNPLPPPSR